MLHELSLDPVTGRLHDHSADDGADLAQALRARTRAYLNQLPSTERRILRWLVGLDGESLSAEEIADRLNMSTDQVWRAVDRGLAEIGLYTLSDTTVPIKEAA